MCSSGSYKSEPVASVVPGATDVSSGKTSDSETAMNKILESRRKKRGVSSTVRNTGADGNEGKKLLGE